MRPSIELHYVAYLVILAASAVAASFSRFGKVVRIIELERHGVQVVFECVRVAVNVICPGQPQLRDNDINANPGNNISYTHSLHVQRPLRRTLFVEYAFNEVIDLRRGEAFVRLIYLLEYTEMV